ncbi:SLATT domain-containing protein [Gallaecimonas sp. GXIMD1310]|uniref:SLATT domain-containing protein n=1 Tax=Gallaecimonas sp. GXIMD1310 TaxID=3131926 RepID=UPI0032459D13
MSDDQKKLLGEWYRRVTLSSQSHYNHAQWLSKANLWLGATAAVISAIIGTSVFATLQQNIAIWIRIIVASLSISAAILAAFQTLFNFSDRAEKHRIYGSKYGAIRRKIDMVISQNKLSDDEFKGLTAEISVRLDDFASEAPKIPSKVWLKTEERYKKRFSIEFPFKEI